MNRALLRPSENGLLGWPEAWTRRYHNAIHEPCDMLIGPCACGAWHHAEEWADAGHICCRRIDGVPVLDFYNAAVVEGPVAQTPLTLSFF